LNPRRIGLWPLGVRPVLPGIRESEALRRFDEAPGRGIESKERSRPAGERDRFPSAEQGARMAQAIVNPEELRRFARTLKEFNSELTGRMSALASQLNSLGNTWRDQENIKFTEEFEQHMKVLARFIEANNEHIPYLVRKAERIEEYLHQK
jgi:uncharacterized protein YukE